MTDPLKSAPVAYENPAFLNSPDGRILRIMAEYQEPLARFRREATMLGAALERGKWMLVDTFVREPSILVMVRPS